MEIKPIGIIHSPFKNLIDMPIQPKGAGEKKAAVELFKEYVQGLKDLDQFSHIYLIYQFHKSETEKTRVIPFLDKVERGIFATRSPQRPNHIGISVVRLLEIKDNILLIQGVDVLDGTPLLDIKPYIAKFDSPQNPTSGWMRASEQEIRNKRSDDRFAD